MCPRGFRVVPQPWVPLWAGDRLPGTGRAGGLPGKAGMSIAAKRVVLVSLSVAFRSPSTSRTRVPGTGHRLVAVFDELYDVGEGRTHG